MELCKAVIALSRRRSLVEQIDGIASYA
jgi:hypothetical protein